MGTGPFERMKTPRAGMVFPSFPGRRHGCDAASMSGTDRAHELGAHDFKAGAALIETGYRHAAAALAGSGIPGRFR